MKFPCLKARKFHVDNLPIFAVTHSSFGPGLESYVTSYIIVSTNDPYSVINVALSLPKIAHAYSIYP